MKKTILTMLILTMMSSCFSQEIQNQDKQLMTKDDYLRRSKSQKTTGILLALGGTGCFIAGSAIMINDVGRFIEPPNPQPPEESNGVGPGLFLLGLAGIIASIPLLKAAHKNKKLAMSLSVSNEIIPGRRPQALAVPAMPVASVRIRF